MTAMPIFSETQPSRHGVEQEKRSLSLTETSSRLIGQRLSGGPRQNLLTAQISVMCFIA